MVVNGQKMMVNCKKWEEIQKELRYNYANDGNVSIFVNS